MTTRERVLIVAMAGAAVWGAATLGAGYYQKNRASVKTALLRDEIRVFAEQHRALAAPLRLSGPERRVLNEAIAAWAESPFIDREAAATAVAEPVQQFFYTGYVQIGAQQFAILNGREYRVSEPVAQTDFRVESIRPEQVELVSSSGGRRLTIALETSKEKRKSK